MYSLLQPQVAFAVAQEKPKASLACGHLGAADDRGEERVGDVGNDQAERLRLARDQPPGHAVRDIVEGLDSSLDLALRLGVDS